MHFPNLLNLLRRRGGGRPIPEDELDGAEVAEVEVEEEPRVSATVAHPAAPAAERLATPSKKGKNLACFVVGFAILLLCVCGMFLYAALPEETNPEIAASNATQTIIVATVQAYSAQATPQVPKVTPKPGTVLPTAVQKPAVATARQTAIVAPTPTVTVTVTPTVVVVAYVPPWQREYNIGIETFKTIFGLLIFAGLIFGGSAALAWYLSFPMRMPNRQTKISYAQGPVTITWSVSVQKRIISVPLFGLVPILRFRWLGGTAISDLMEGLASLVQSSGFKIKLNEDMGKDFALFFEELNSALAQERAGEKYDNSMRKRSAKIPEHQRYVMSIVSGIIPKLHDLEERFEITIYQFVILEGFAQMGSELEQYFAGERQKAARIQAIEEAEALEAAERDRIARDLEIEFERQELTVTAVGKMVGKQVNTYCAQRGIALDSPEAAKAGESFLAREGDRLRLEAQERLEKLKLEVEQERTRSQAAVGSETAQAQMLQARAWQTGMDALEKLLAGLDVQTILTLALQQRQGVAERGKTGGGNGQNKS